MGRGLLALVVGMLIACPAQADDDMWAVLSVGSYHTQRHHQNENNFGVGIEYGLEKDARLIAGVYNNSIEETSMYVAVAWMPFKLGPFRLGSVMGMVTGYVPDMPLPMLALAGSYEAKRWGVNVGYVPAAAKGIYMLQVKTTF